MSAIQQIQRALAIGMIVCGFINPASAVQAPTGVSASDGTFTEKVRVIWNAVSGAASYELWRNTSSDNVTSPRVLYGTVTSPLADDTTAVPGTLYYYWVKARNGNLTSLFSLPDTGYRQIGAPTGVTATDGTYTDKVQVAWSAASGATNYGVWRCVSNDIASSSNLGTTATTTYDDLTAAKTPGKILYYWVKAVNAIGASGFSTSDSGYVKPTIGPTIKANGEVGDVAVNYPDAMSITIEVNEDAYAGASVDWWVVSHAGSSWYYLNNSMQWTQFDGNVSHCAPMYQGASCNLPATPLPVLNIPGLPPSSYTFWFAVDALMDGVLNEAGPISTDSVNVTMLSALPAPCIKANGAEGEITVKYPGTVSITIEMDARAYAGIPVDWWVLGSTGSSWYYLDSSMHWIPDGNMLNWRPVNQCPLFNLPAATVLTYPGLPMGTYTFYFAVDYPMDGILNLEPIWADSVKVNVQ